jgi:biopolymer transport protein ExbD/biopolymer transport protein TolR
MAMDLEKASKPGRAQPTMNVTPLVDVVLVLLIIFMVVTPLLAKQFWIHLPNQVEKDEPQNSDDSDAPVVVSVNKAGDILINRDKVPESIFVEKLRGVLAAKHQRTIFFDAEDEADFALAVKAMDLARGGGASTIAVVTDPLKR